MKKNELKEVRSKSAQELKKDLQTARKELAKTRLDLFAGKNKNVRQLKNLRKNIAQISTLLNQKSEVEKS